VRLLLPDVVAVHDGGQIDREVALLRGARRVGGWRAWVVYFFFGLATIAVLWTVIATAVHVF
jgi:hypothetical protein